jgi:predicted secreted protein
MADLTKAVQGKDVLHYITQNGGSSYLAIVCLTQNAVSATKNSADTDTKCGVITSVGNPSVTYTGTGVMISDPESNELSYMDLFHLFILDDDFGIVEKNSDNTIFAYSNGQITDISSDNSSNGPATFNYTIKGSGSVALSTGSIALLD